MLRITTLLLIVFLVACDKGRKAPPTDAPVTPPTVTPAVKAKKGVPQSLTDRIAKEWPDIKANGDAFVAKFKEATAARAEGDRAKMDVAIEAAQKHFNDALEGWNGIYYSVDDYSEDQAEACRKYMRKWNKQVDGWTKKAKGLKEFSRVK